jgi:Pentapeptide repeats (8 copies)
VLAAGFVFQGLAQQDSVSSGAAPSSGLVERRQLDKLTAEVKEIRSNTSGSLYWLKLAGLFLAVGAAVGGYLVAQSRSSRDRAASEAMRTRLRLDFDRRAQVDAAFQAIVQELSSESALLRATAAMKLGKLLQAPPIEWHLEAPRRDELWSLTKQILAASLAIETDEKVRKALTIAIGLHSTAAERGNLRELDLSLARAADAYWANIDFSYADFYRADLTRASLRRSTLSGAQFRETVLANAVLADATCNGTNFKFADLRGADLSGADLTAASFEHAKVYGVVLTGATLEDIPEYVVDISPGADGAQTVLVNDWISTL